MWRNYRSRDTAEEGGERWCEMYDDTFGAFLSRWTTFLAGSRISRKMCHAPSPKSTLKVKKEMEKNRAELVCPANIKHGERKLCRKMRNIL